MKQTITILLAVMVGFLAAVIWFDHRPAAPSPTASPDSLTGSGSPAPRMAGAPDRVPGRRLASPEPAQPDWPAIAPAPAARTPQDLLNELAAIQITPGPGQARAQYRILALLDQLAQSGAAALPALRQFLAGDRDVAYNSTSGGGRKGNGNPLLPPSLRMGLFDVVRQIGGTEAEAILSETLAATGRSAELAYLGQLLEELSPGKYREATLTAARNLLASGKITAAAERNQLYDVLVAAKDTSLVNTALAGLIQTDGKVDATALRYLQQSLGEKSVAFAAQTLADPRVADADSREALARGVLTYVGASANEQVAQVYHNSILDPTLTPAQRKELVLDLDQDGLLNDKNLTPTDIPIVARRYTLTQSYLQQDYVKNDKTLNAAFLEANKDLAKLLQRAGVNPPAAGPGN
ncbi:MAG: hypothetical protein EXS35_03730 [Pedosphaera sp.]|nr:hypothetical protein [Pedosphaera sp.]